ncbi:hypothetical protein EHQ12_02265 [Leptospira gomenensis]|uniref:Lipoprotein n=1 Tax=Leptospira gomenensis TaxID=2484974 RepID=A0A5F1YM13_9LEPT|nr:hypothetical protein [Leptospira gomenensis]TGK33740.1 hypothetical protein EHQ17_10580 [Leptospira gomenensis]TGK41983.1 hypothetical protein EHQ07_15220 [Leptospira gomenensis]TGK44195.1 hypothetical protein EHQ12_02265 [Leptospira gomenensis]TGK57983.1 hypothetical protein EHQ13_14550 [Leptospira gomenensis]
MRSATYTKFPNKISALFLFLLFQGCGLLDPFYTVVDETDSDKVTREEAKDSFYSAVVLKAAICGEESQRWILKKTLATFSEDLCEEDKDLDVYSESDGLLRSCSNRFTHVRKSNVNVCVSEVLYSPCESPTQDNYGIGYGYINCSSMLNARPYISGM